MLHMRRAEIHSHRFPLAEKTEAGKEKNAGAKPAFSY
jgi:hypothetical protein